MTSRWNSDSTNVPKPPSTGEDCRTKTADLELDIDTKIKELSQEDTYKYLGVNEAKSIQNSAMKEKIRKEYYRRVRMILKSELNAANRLEAINVLVIPVVTYSFNIIKWKLSDIKRLVAKTRKILTMKKMHHRKLTLTDFICLEP